MTCFGEADGKGKAAFPDGKKKEVTAFCMLLTGGRLDNLFSIHSYEYIVNKNFLT